MRVLFQDLPRPTFHIPSLLDHGAFAITQQLRVRRAGPSSGVAKALCAHLTSIAVANVPRTWSERSGRPDRPVSTDRSGGSWILRRIWFSWKSERSHIRYFNWIGACLALRTEDCVDHLLLGLEQQLSLAHVGRGALDLEGWLNSC